MKFKDHLDFHKLPFDKEKIREQVEKIAADCMRWVTRRQNARPLLAMASVSYTHLTLPTTSIV